MKRPASFISALFLIAIAIGHLLRIIFGVSIVAAGNDIPMWPSVFAMIVTAALAIWLLKEQRT